MKIQSLLKLTVVLILSYSSFSNSCDSIKSSLTYLDKELSKDAGEWGKRMGKKTGMDLRPIAQFVRSKFKTIWRNADLNYQYRKLFADRLLVEYASKNDKWGFRSVSHLANIDYRYVKNSFDEIRHPIYSDIDPSKLEGRNAFEVAVESGSYDVIEELVKNQKVDVNQVSKGQYAMHTAVKKNDLKMVKLLHDLGCSLEKPNGATEMQPVQLAANQNNHFFRWQGMHPQQSRTDTVWADKRDIVRYLLECDVNIDTTPRLISHPYGVFIAHPNAVEEIEEALGMTIDAYKKNRDKQKASIISNTTLMPNGVSAIIASY